MRNQMRHQLRNQLFLGSLILVFVVPALAKGDAALDSSATPKTEAKTAAKAETKTETKSKAPKMHVLDRTVGSIGIDASLQVLTSRTVRIAGITEKWSLLHGNPNHNEKSDVKENREDWLVQDGTPAFANQLSMLIMDGILAAEAESFAVAHIDEVEIDRQVVRMRESLKGWADWDRMDPSIEELTKIMGQHLRASEFLKLKSAAMGFQVSDEEARAYYDSNRIRFGSSPYSNFRETIKEFLSRRQSDTKLKDWLQVLRRKYHARNFDVDQPKDNIRHD